MSVTSCATIFANRPHYVMSLHSLLDNIGNPFSARNISGRMVSGGIKTTTATVLNFKFDYFNEAFILLKCRYDIKGASVQH